MTSITKLGCGLILTLAITISGVYPLDFWFDPRHEHDWTEACLNGRQQSPIAITKCGRTNLDRLNLEYKNFEISINQVTVTNSGRQTVFDWDRKAVERSVIVRTSAAAAARVAPFKANTEYILQNVHVHHGRNGHTGTLHSIDGSFYAMEMHLLFAHRQFDNNTAAAFTALGNILEIVVLWQESNVSNDAWSKLNNLMLGTALKESEKVTGKFTINFIDFLPKNSRYTLYHGSTPTSRCLEAVTWIIYDNVMKFNTVDLGMRHFKYISDGVEIPLERNTRSIQSQNGRPIFEATQEKVSHYRQ